MNLPQGFIKNIHNAFGDDGHLWLNKLPELVDKISHQWNLSNVQAVPNLSYNFVAFANRPERSGGAAQSTSYSKGKDEEVVLKIGVPNNELASEMAALRLFDGNGAVRLLEEDEENSAFLLERIRPGETLSTLEDDDAATNIAADVMLKLWRPLEPLESRSSLLDVEQQAVQKFIKLTDWFGELKNLRPMFNCGVGPFPEKIISRVEETLPHLFAESSPPCLIHGDLHHFNILSSANQWLAIDPKGVIGNPEYEVGPLLINPMPNFLNGSQPKVRAERRIAVLSERLGFPRQCLKDWGLCHAVLSAWWDMSPDGVGSEYSIQCAEIFADI